MKIEQIITTKIVADEGKVFRKKSSGVIYGDTIHLGYDYYDAGVGLSQADLLTPDDFEEIDIPEGYEEKPVIDQVKRLQRTSELIKQNTEEINSLGLSDNDALKVKEWYPRWEDYIGKEIAEGFVTLYNDNLWRARQTHTAVEIYPPSLDTASLYEVIVKTHEGTMEDPIPYEGNMALEEGKYYRQYEVVYLCTRDTINPVYNDLKDLVGLYVEMIER